MPLDRLGIALLLQQQSKCAHVGDPFEGLALHSAHCDLGVVFKHGWIVAVLRAGQRWINEVIVWILWPVVLCCRHKCQQQHTQQAYERLHVQSERKHNSRGVQSSSHYGSSTKGMAERRRDI